MKRLLSLIALLLIAAMVTPPVQADTLSFTLNFTSPDPRGYPLPTGSFVYNTTTNQFTSFAISTTFVYLGGNNWTDNFNFLSAANSFNLSPLTPAAACNGATSAQTFLNVLVGCDPGITAAWDHTHLFGDSQFIVSLNDATHQFNEMPCAFPVYYPNSPNPFPPCQVPIMLGGAGPQWSDFPVMGTFTVTQTGTTVPEPTSAALTLVGIGSGLLMRKRTARLKS